MNTEKKKLSGSKRRKQNEELARQEEAKSCMSIRTFFKPQNERTECILLLKCSSSQLNENVDSTKTTVNRCTTSLSDVNMCNTSCKESFASHQNDDCLQKSSPAPETIPETISKRKETDADSNNDDSCVEKPVSEDDPVNPPSNDSFERKARIDRGPYQPILKQEKPIVSSNRKFQSSWFERFKWLEYSEHLDRAFCFPCRFFAGNDSRNQGHIDPAFISKGFCTWKNGVQAYIKHEQSKCHASSLCIWDEYRLGKPIDSAIDASREITRQRKVAEVKKNRNAVVRVVEIIRTLIKGGKPFRGHNENIESHERGLFLEMITLLSKYDDVLKNHIYDNPKSNYLSNRSQNEMIQVFGELIKQKIKTEINDKAVAIISDDTSDVGHHEQMSIAIRYVSNSGDVEETLIGMRRLLKTDAETIFNELNVVAKSLEIQWENVTAVCFDGASTMSGSIKGVQARCKQENPAILYVHCYAHCLNLVLVAACSNHKYNKRIFDFFGVVQLIYNFIEGSPTRHAVLETLIKSTNAKLNTLKTLSTTRWTCRAEAVSAIQAQFCPIVEAIEEIVNTTPIAAVKATGKGILSQMKSFDFIISLEIMHPLLQSILIVSKKLQSTTMDLVEGMSAVDDLKSALMSLRQDESKFKTLFATAADKCNELEIPIQAGRKKKVSRRIDDHPETSFTETSKEHEVWNDTFLPLLDTCIAELTDRYSQDTTDLITGVGKLIEFKASEDDIKNISKQFTIDFSNLLAETNLLQYRKEDEYPPKTLHKWLDWLNKVDRRTTYPNFYKVISDFLTIPVTSCKCERGFSKLVIVKNKLRSTMMQDRLEPLLLGFVEQDILLSINADDVIDRFAEMVPERKLQLKL